MDVSDGYRALALIKERFGQKISPDAAFKLIDHTLRTGHATNLGLKQVICAAAFERGLLLGALERVIAKAYGGDPLSEMRWYLDLLEHEFDAPAETPADPDDKPRIIAP